jgi:hypothetical protein
MIIDEEFKLRAVGAPREPGKVVEGGAAPQQGGSDVLLAQLGQYVYGTTVCRWRRHLLTRQA